MDEYIISFFKAFGLFIMGLIAFRIMGSQTVGRLTDFDLVVVIAIGALIGDALADPELNTLIIIFAIAGLVLAQVITSILAMKSPFFEKIVVGSPIKLVDKGKILMNGLRKARMTKKNLSEELRVKGLMETNNVEQAFLEPNGKLSVIEKQKSSSKHSKLEKVHQQGSEEIMPIITLSSKALNINEGGNGTMAQQVDTNMLKKAEAATSIAKDMIASAIEQSAANQTLCEESLRQAANEIAQAKTVICQVLSSMQVPRNSNH